MAFEMPHYQGVLAMTVMAVVMVVVMVPVIALMVVVGDDFGDDNLITPDMAFLMT